MAGAVGFLEADPPEEEKIIFRECGHQTDSSNRRLRVGPSRNDVILKTKLSRLVLCVTGRSQFDNPFGRYNILTYS